MRSNEHLVQNLKSQKNLFSKELKICFLKIILNLSLNSKLNLFNIIFSILRLR